VFQGLESNFINHCWPCQGIIPIDWLFIFL
jgi:hypothetical protein